MKINVGLIILALGLPIVIALMKTAANERLCQEARAFSGIFAFLTAVGIMISTIFCLVDKHTICVDDLIKIDGFQTSSEKYCVIAR